MTRKVFFARGSARPAGAASAVSHRCLVETLEARTLLAAIPAGFQDSVWASALSNPTSMAFAPDGRLFVTQQGGQLRVITRNAAGAGQLLPASFLTVGTDSSGERGLLGVALDPDFQANGYVYVYYTVPQATRFNRVSRFTAADADPAPDVFAPGNVAQSGSELVLMNLDPLSATNHNGGAMHFGPDNKLYVAVGDNAVGGNSQSFNNRHGKMLRINSDGSIPADNPFLGNTTGVNRAIWAMGLRNPYTFAFQPGTGRMFINDVGDNGLDTEKWEEINEGGAGRNYGWPNTGDGYFNAATFPQFTNPLHAYNHTTGGRAITGGAFYNPAVQNFPSAYVGDYFFADFAGGFIRKLEAPITGARLNSNPFATGAARPVDLAVGPDGNLYYLARGSGTVGRIRYTASLAPSIGTQPDNQSVPQGATATFTASASGDAPLNYQWQRAGAAGGAFTDITGATSPSYTTPATTAADEGARFRVVVTNAHGSATSNEAVLNVVTNQAPAPVIVAPAQGATFAAGELITFEGSATDPEDGTLPAGAYRWEILYYTSTVNGTGGVRRPYLEVFDVMTGTFRIADTGPYTNADVFYRIELTVEDSQGLTTTVVRDINPRTSGVTLSTSVPGLTLNLDGQPQAAPYAFVGVEGFKRLLEAPATQTAGGTTYEFVSWSDGGARSHEIVTPVEDTTYTATYRPVAGPPAVVGRHVFYNNSVFDGRDPAATAADDAAIAADKSALLPGQKASFSNLTSYSRGINGVMLDVANLSATTTVAAGDFAFATGKGEGKWVDGPAPADVALRRGAGVNGSDRVTLTWADGRIANRWLRITFTPPSPAASPVNRDVFYFGNLRGETGDPVLPDATRLAVTAYDTIRTRRALYTRTPPLDRVYDHNRDGRVNVLDLSIVGRNRGQSLTLFTAAPPPAVAARVSDGVLV